MNKPRNNTRIESQIQHLKTITTPQIRVRSAKANPPAITNNGKFINRRVAVTLSSPSVLTVADVSLALKNTANNGPIADFFITKISVWNPTVGGANSASANVSVQNLLTSGRSAGGSDQIFVADYGTGTSLAGFDVMVPAMGSLLQNFDTTSTSQLLNSISAGVSPLVHVTVLQQL